MDMMESKIYKNPYTRFLTNKNKVIFANIREGFWVKTSMEMYNFICEAVEKGKTIKEMISEGEDEYTKKFIEDFIKKLIRNSLLDVEEKFENKQEDQLEQIYINLTNRCNLRCIHCCVSAGEDVSDELSFEDMCRVIDACIELNPKKITLTGGEVFVRKDIEEIIKYTSNNFHGIIAVMTNGVLVDDKRIKLIKENVDEVYLSLDGYDEKTTDYIRGKYVFKKVMNLIKDLKNAGIDKISLSMVETKITKNHREDFENLCSKLGVQPMVRKFEPMGRGERNSDVLMIDESENYDMIKRLKENKNLITAKSLCGAGRTVLSIDCMGNIYSCELLQDAEFRLGNILDNKQKAEAEFNFSKLDKCLLDTIEGCKECNVRYFCSTSCPNSDRITYTNESYRKSRCNMLKEHLYSSVWGNVQ